MRRWAACGMLALALALSLGGCLREGEDRVDVAISMCDMDTTRNVALYADVADALEGAGFRVAVRDAERNLSRQIEDIRALLQQKPRYLLVVALRSIGLREAISDAAEQGARVILLDRFSLDAAEDDVLAWIGMDAEWAGRACARVIAEQLAGREGSVLELTGEPGASNTNAFSLGFREELCNHQNLQLAGVVEGDFNRNAAQRGLTDFIGAQGQARFDAVFGHSDEEGIGAIRALLALNASGQIPIVCTGGQDDARRALLAGQLGAVVATPPAYGGAVLDALRRADAGQPVEKRQLMCGQVFTAADAARMAGY